MDGIRSGFDRQCQNIDGFRVAWVLPGVYSTTVSVTKLNSPSNHFFHSSEL